MDAALEQEITMKLGLSTRHSGVRLALAVALPLALSLPSVASAQEVVVVQQGGPRSEVDRYPGPNWAAFSSGLAVFGGTYIGSIVVAGTSSHAGDKDLYIPLVGPWIDMANRCSGPGSCNGDLGNKVLLGLDGVFQGIGAISIATSFFMRDRREGLGRRASVPTFQIAPASVGRGAPGLTMVGTF
jgi:hypothetical protein